MPGPFVTYLLAEALTRLLPRKVGRSLSRGIGHCYAPLSGHLESIATNLRQVLASNLSEEELRKNSRTLLVNFSEYLADLFYMDRLCKAFVDDHVKISGRKHLDDALAKKNGVILASAHVGNWEMGSVVLTKLGYRVHAVTVKHLHAMVDKLFQHRRRRAGLQVILLGEPLSKIYRVLYKNDVLAISGDRLFGTDGIAVDFMDRKVVFPKGPTRISLSTGAPICPAFFVPTGEGRYLLEIQAPIEISKEDKMTQAFADRVTEIVRRYPLQWFIFKPYWEMPQWPI